MDPLDAPCAPRVTRSSACKRRSNEQPGCEACKKARRSCSYRAVVKGAIEDASVGVVDVVATPAESEVLPATLTESVVAPLVAVVAAVGADVVELEISEREAVTQVNPRGTCNRCKHRGNRRIAAEGGRAREGCRRQRKSCKVEGVALNRPLEPAQSSGVEQSRTESRKRKAEEERRPRREAKDSHERTRKRRKIHPEMCDFVVQGQGAVKESSWGESQGNEWLMQRLTVVQKNLEETLQLIRILSRYYC